MSALLRRRELLGKVDYIDESELKPALYITNGGTRGVFVPASGAYIDTGVVDNDKNIYHIEFKYPNNSITGLQYEVLHFVMGSCNTTGTGVTATQIFSTVFPVGNDSYGTNDSMYTKNVAGMWIGARATYDPIALFGQLEPGVSHVIDLSLKDNTVTVASDGVLRSDSKIVSRTTSIKTQSTDYSCYLFAVNFRGNPREYNYSLAEYVTTVRLWARLYAFSIKDGDTGEYLFNGMPMFATINGEDIYGLYDSVKKKFLVSPNGIAFEGEPKPSD